LFVLAVFGGVTPLARCAASRCALPNDTPKTNKIDHIKGKVLVIIAIARRLIAIANAILKTGET
jgi:hypothetical protein